MIRINISIPILKLCMCYITHCPRSASVIIKTETTAIRKIIFRLKHHFSVYKKLLFTVFHSILEIVLRGRKNMCYAHFIDEETEPLKH